MSSALQQEISTVAPGRPEDIAAIARIHRAALADDVLPRLGERYLREQFYPACLASPRAAVWVTKTDGAVSGVVIVADDSDFPKLFLSPRRLWALLQAVAQSPLVLLELIGFSFKRTTAVVTGKEIAVLAVAPVHQGRGLGRLLTRAALEHCRGQDLFVKTSSAGALAFYKKQGFVAIGHEHRLFKRYVVMQARGLARNLDGGFTA